MRRILITNDDGIFADGLIRLAEAAKDFGEVWIVAPRTQRSASSHSITLHSTIDLYPTEFPVGGVRAFACSGTPADCVRAGVRYVLPKKPDAVLAGINFGFNVATDLQYSGTAAAAFEGAFQGVPSISLSETVTGSHEVTDVYLKIILEKLLFTDLGPHRIWNVNFPCCPVSECGGILYDRKVSKGKIYDDHYIRQEDLPGGGVRLFVKGDRDGASEPETDLDAVNHNYVSVGTVTNVGN